MTPHFNEISKLMERLARRYELSNIFNDLLTLSICSFHRKNLQSRLKEKDAANEDIYLQAIGKYAKEDINVFSQIIDDLVLNAEENPYSDILGEYFMQHITHGQNGQFFTPEPVCEMMAAMKGEAGSIHGIKVHDPACGSGRLMLQFAKLNPDNYFYGADNSNSCAKMTTLNFFLNGLRGEISWMDSLSMDWYGGWHVNLNGLGIVPIEKEQSFIWSQPPEPEQTSPSITRNTRQNNKVGGAQLTLF